MNINLIKGDCLLLMKSIPDKSIDAIITDPPYGTTACKWDSVIPFDLMWEQLNRIIKPNGAIVLFGTEPFSSYLRISNIKNYKYDWVWDKGNPTNFAMAKRQPMRYTEQISVFYKKQCTYNPIKWVGAKNHKQGVSKSNFAETRGNIKRVIDDLSGLKFPKNTIEIKKHSSQCGLHPTQKPVALMEYLIKTYTNENETILDFTMGSGSTGVACVNTNRNFIGIEQDDKYFEIAKNRIEESKYKLF
jgi:site-specific DNA-methyltransferase (adenine-specific)